MADRCSLTELLVTDCAHCRGHQDPPREPATAELGPWFTARFDGRCSACDNTTYEGDQIRADGFGGYLCLAWGCGEDKDDG